MTKKKSVFLGFIGALLVLSTGTLFSFFTGYVARDEHLVITVSVWVLNIAIAHMIIIAVFRIKDKTIKYRNPAIFMLIMLFSTIGVIMISGSLEYAYVVTFLSLWVFWGVYVYIIKDIMK